MKPYPKDSIEGIAKKERIDEKTAYGQLYPPMHRGQEKNVEAMVLADQAKVIGDYLHVAKDLEKSIKQKVRGFMIWRNKKKELNYVTLFSRNLIPFFSYRRAMKRLSTLNRLLLTQLKMKKMSQNE